MNKNKVVLTSFVNYCNMHPEMRFWQALRSWAGANFILAITERGPDDCITAESKVIVVDHDTFYWEGKKP